MLNSRKLYIKINNISRFKIMNTILKIIHSSSTEQIILVIPHPKIHSVKTPSIHQMWKHQQFSPSPMRFLHRLLQNRQIWLQCLMVAGVVESKNCTSFRHPIIKNLKMWIPLRPKNMAFLLQPVRLKKLAMIRILKISWQTTGSLMIWMI